MNLPYLKPCPFCGQPVVIRVKPAFLTLHSNGLPSSLLIVHDEKDTSCIGGLVEEVASESPISCLLSEMLSTAERLANRWNNRADA